VSADPFANDRFLVEQLVRPIVNLYQVTPLAAGEAPAGGPIAYVRQKRMAIKEDIRFFADEQETQEVFRIKARSMFDIGGARYGVKDAEGAEVVTAQERSLPMAIARRIVDFVPYGEWVPIPYNFDLLMDGRAIGHMNRKLQLRDRYVLDLSGDQERRLDRRLAIALAVGLDTLQNR
jgi:uncharacterized protein YxjI